MQVATKNKKVGYRRVIMVRVWYVILILFKFRQADVLGFTSVNSNTYHIVKIVHNRYLLKIKIKMLIQEIVQPIAL